MFKLPVSETFSISSLTARFLLQDGRQVLETRVTERELAKVQYEDSVASGKTAVMATLPTPSEKFLVQLITLNLGNFPPQSTLILTAKCS
jgi:hypothetical protein